MFKNFTKIIAGDPLRRQLERYSELVRRINEQESLVRSLSDAELRSKTNEFKTRLSAGEGLDDLPIEAFAVVREASARTIGLRHFDVQLIGGMVLHKGKIAEMRTGEGKTLVATLPLYLNALEGKGVHLVTVNDYLARRDARWMGPIYHLLGLSVGVLQEAARTEYGRKAFLYDPAKVSSQEDVHQLRMVDRAQAYAADITYGTNNEFGFDYLRDNMTQTLEARVQRGHHYSIVDEVDNILIDEARTPLIISGPSQDDPELYYRMAQVVKQLRAEDHEVSEKDRTVSLTEIGENHVEEVLGTPLRDPERPEDITPEQARLMGHLEQALRAAHLFKRNKDYVVQGGRVIIVDEFTGRLMAGRRWSDGLHQAIEAKEGVRVREDNVTYATVTLQNYFRMYKKLAGMTGTALTEAEEFHKIYNVDVTPLPTNLEYIAMQPDSNLIETEYRENGYKFRCFARRDDPGKKPVYWRRKDYPDVVYRTEESKLRAVSTEILHRHVLGQPLLVGTTSVEMSERLSGRLRGEPLQRLAMILILRDAYMEAHGLKDEGLRIEELQPLYEPLDSLNQADLRTFARDLGLALNPTRPEHLSRLAGVLDLSEGHTGKLGEVLERGIRHNVLNAKKHDEESRIIADAGALGAVTIATNMAGRGVDIKLGGEVAEEVIGAVNRVLRRAGVTKPEDLTDEERLAALDGLDSQAIGIYTSEAELFRKFISGEGQVKDVGGLHVIGSVRHDARRIDNQLRGRAARQGDPGSSQFFLSLQDELMRLFGGVQVSGLMERLNIDDAVPIAHNIVDRTIEQAQTRVEGANFDTRKHLLEYDDVLNQQREVYYGQRNRVMTKDDLSDDIEAMLVAEIERRVKSAFEDPDGGWKLLAWLEEVQPTFGLDTPDPYPSLMVRLLAEGLAEVNTADALGDALLGYARKALASYHTHLAQVAREQLDHAVERLADQIRQRTDLAEMTVDGLLMEAEEKQTEVEAQAMVKAVEQAAGVRIQIDEAGLRQIRNDPSQFKRMVPRLMEGSLGLRVWGGVVQGVERRLGESLGLPMSLSSPVNWDEAGDRLEEALERQSRSREERIQAEIREDLKQALAKADTLDLSLKTRLLVQMSYGQRSLFDARTHTRRSVVVARLTYPFLAAERLPLQDPHDLQRSILDHLRGAMEAFERAVGRADWLKLGGSKIEDLDPRLQKGLRRLLGEEGFEAVASTGSLSAVTEDAPAEIAPALGRLSLTEYFRRLILSVGDRLWVEYLTQVEALRTSIGLEAYGQRDPLVQYKSRAFDMFQQLLAEIRSGVVSRLFRLPAPAQAQPVEAPSRESRLEEAPPARVAPTDAPGKPERKGHRRRRH